MMYMFFFYKHQSSIIDIYMDEFMISSDGKILATASGQLKTFGCSDNKKLQKFSGHPVCYIYILATLSSFFYIMSSIISFFINSLPLELT